jgi:hypothetical protein
MRIDADGDHDTVCRAESARHSRSLPVSFKKSAESRRYGIHPGRKQRMSTLVLKMRGALCFPTPDGLPLFGQLNLSGVVIDGPKPIATLARRPGHHSAEVVDRMWRALDRAFPVA